MSPEVLAWAFIVSVAALGALGIEFQERRARRKCPRCRHA